MNTIESLLAFYPSHFSLAEDLGAEPDRVYRWFRNNRIPQERWREVIASAAGRGHSITIEQLFEACTPRSNKVGWPKGVRRIAR